MGAGNGVALSVLNWLSRGARTDSFLHRLSHLGAGTGDGEVLAVSSRAKGKIEAVNGPATCTEQSAGAGTLPPPLPVYRPLLAEAGNLRQA